MRDELETTNKSPPKELDLKVSRHERNLIELTRRTEYGELRIVVKGGEPIQVDELKKSIKL